mgnify:CR=1 FL=1
MATGIFRTNVIGELEELPQEHIDYWCHLCQFPLAEGRCKDKALIQKCWDGTGSVAGRWHFQHECPFIPQGQRCKCNDFETIEEAFRAAGLDYKKGGENYGNISLARGNSDSNLAI